MKLHSSILTLPFLGFVSFTDTDTAIAVGSLELTVGPAPMVAAQASAGADRA